jgi:hypothetical protein
VQELFRFKFWIALDFKLSLEKGFELNQTSLGLNQSAGPLLPPPIEMVFHLLISEESYVTPYIMVSLITFIKVLIKTQIHWLIQFRVAQGQNLNQNLEASP